MRLARVPIYIYDHIYIGITWSYLRSPRWQSGKIKVARNRPKLRRYWLWLLWVLFIDLLVLFYRYTQRKTLYLSEFRSNLDQNKYGQVILTCNLRQKIHISINCHRYDGSSRPLQVSFRWMPGTIWEEQPASVHYLGMKWDAMSVCHVCPRKK